MDLPVVLLLFMLYTVVVGTAALAYFLIRRRRVTNGGLPIPNTAGLNLKPLSERAAFKWEGAETRPAESAPTLDHQSFAPVGITPGAYAPINISPVTAAPPVEAPRYSHVEPTRADDDAAFADDHITISSETIVEAAFTRALSEIFGAHGPLLPEGMRTLEVSPNRFIAPGSIVHAAFVFRNLGGGTASGFRVRFRLPMGLTYSTGTARIDDTPIDEQGNLSPLLDETGADIGDVPAGSERRVALAFVVAPTIENSTVVALQAAVASADVPVIGSNIVRLIVRSAPMLQNAKTTLSLAPVREALPGEELMLSARVHNSGQSSAHDVVVLLPLPANTTFCPNSATIDGNYAGISDRVPFGFAQPTVVAPVLRPGATIDVGYRVRINTPLEDGTPIAAHGAVCSQEIAEFSLPPVVINVPSSASFASTETTFRVDSAGAVESGERVRFVLHAKNVGTAAARKLALKISLPDGMLYTPGSLSIDGAPAADDGLVPDTFMLGDLEPDHAVELALSAIVRSPIANGSELRATALIAWSKGQREFERVLTARSAPRFPTEFNKLDSDIARRITPGESVGYSIVLQNMGTDSATAARLMLRADDGLSDLRVWEGNTAIAFSEDGSLALGTLEPGIIRSLRVEANVSTIIEDQTQLELGAMLSTAQTPNINLGERTHIVDSRPVFSISRSVIAAESDAGLRFKEASTLRIILSNEGSDRGRDVRAFLALPEELRLEDVEGDATREGDTIVFGDIPAGSVREAQLTIRLVGMISGGDPLMVSARVVGRNVVPFALRPIELATHGGASFSEGARLVAAPADAVDAGAELEYTLVVRNSGEGAAKHLTARIASLSNAVYAQGSTVINGIALADRSGTSVLLGETGLRLADIGSGIEVIARWRVIVNMPLPPTATVETAASVSWDDVPEMRIVAQPVAVRSASALPITDPNLPFSVLGATAAPRKSTTPAVTQPQLPNGKAPRVELGPGVAHEIAQREVIESASDADDDVMSAYTIEQTPFTSGNDHELARMIEMLRPSVKRAE